MSRRSRNTMCKTIDHGWNSSRKRSEKFGKYSGCGSREDMHSVLVMKVARQQGY